MKSILFIHQGRRSFFDRDLEILKSFAEVQTFDNYPPSFSKGMKLLGKILTCDIVYIWFMGRHAVLPLIFGKIFGKKVIVVAGGWDVVNCPEIEYGLLRPSSSLPFLKGLFHLPNLVVSVSTSNQAELLKNTEIKESKTRIVSLGFEDRLSEPASKKEKMVITVGEVNPNNVKRKGLEQFIRAAAHFPDIPFVLIGNWASHGAITFLKSIATPNVEFTGPLSAKDLDLYMNRAQVYAQLSYHEAFGAALAEAMIHECVPVITHQYALPEVVGDTGYLTAFEDVPGTVKAIQSALQDEVSGKKARKRILENFSLERRKQKLTRLIQTEL